MAKLSIPSDLKYTTSDEWIKVENGEGIIGVTDYAQDALSDVVYVELPQVGESIQAGIRFGTVESVKAASDMHMPITGTITALNDTIEDTPENVNKDPYGAGWFIKIQPTDLSELDKLMDAAAYEKYCAER
ncbi:MAG: glycine cleavage system protein GcvH [Chloroflexota bacterium]